MSRDPEREKRAELRRQQVTVTVSSLENSDQDANPVFGLEGVSLAAVLSREMWSLSGTPLPMYDRAHTPYKFIRNRRLD